MPAPDFSNQLYEGPSLYDGNVLNEIHDSNYDPVPGDYEVLLPAWQNSPVVVDHSRGGTVVLDRTAHMASKNL